MPFSKSIPATTQDHLDVADIADQTVLLKNGSAVQILQTTAVNFDLLSEPEQDAMISAFAHLLNSLSFHIQIVVRSKKIDISAYLENLKRVEENQANPFLKEKMKSYRQFVKQLISKNEVLDKKFYVVVPFTEAPVSSGFTPAKQIFGTKRVAFDRQALLKKAKNQLEPRCEHLIKELSRVGIKAQILTTQELVELFYDIYNPETSRQERIKISTDDYTAPIVEPAME